MKRKPALAVTLSMVFLAAGVSAAAASPQQAKAAAAPAAVVTLDYEMNEGPGASVMNDSGGTGLNGSIGTEVVTGATFDGATGYRFARLKPNTPPTHPQHLVTIPNAPNLNPDAGNYSVEIRYRTTNPFGNLIQKGQSTTPGGQFKIQLPKGKPSCYFKGPDGRDGVGGKTLIDDGAWHVLLCVKTSDSVTLYVDGVKQGRKNGPMGTVNNTFPMSIGGKPQCDQVKVTCDYFGGDVDYVKITKG
jgi:hypothetical protein